MNRIAQMGTTPDPHKRCAHSNFKADVNVQRADDASRFIAALSVRCTECGNVFNFGNGQTQAMIQIFPST